MTISPYDLLTANSLMTGGPAGLAPAISSQLIKQLKEEDEFSEGVAQDIAAQQTANQVATPMVNANFDAAPSAIRVPDDYVAPNSVSPVTISEPLVINTPELPTNTTYQKALSDISALIANQVPQAMQPDTQLSPSAYTELVNRLAATGSEASQSPEVYKELLSEFEAKQQQAKEERAMNPIDWINLGLQNVLSIPTFGTTQTSDQYLQRKYATEEEAIAADYQRRLQGQQAYTNQAQQNLTNLMSEVDVRNAIDQAINARQTLPLARLLDYAQALGSLEAYRQQPVQAALTTQAGQAKLMSQQLQNERARQLLPIQLEAAKQELKNTPINEELKRQEITARIMALEAQINALENPPSYNFGGSGLPSDVDAALQNLNNL